MTKTEVEMKFDNAVYNYISNNTLNKVLAETMEEIGAPQFAKEELKNSKKISTIFITKNRYDTSFGVDQIDFTLKKPYLM